MEERIVAPGVDVASFDAALTSLSVEGYEDEAVEAARTAAAAGEKRPVACWNLRGCAGLMGLVAPMQEECPHSRTDCYSPCPTECQYTVCERPWHRTSSDFNLILDPTVDRMVAVKKSCYTCEYFLKNAPRVGEGASDGALVPDAATKDAAGGVTIHLF